jgi:hypothetical protein
LVRVLCPDCKKAVELDAATTDKIKKFLSALPAKVKKTNYDNY